MLFASFIINFIKLNNIFLINIILNYISTNKIYLIETKDGENDALSIVQNFYEQYDNKEEFRLLNSFIQYCKNKGDFSNKKSSKK